MEDIINELSDLIFHIAYEFTKDKDLINELYNQGVIGVYDAYSNYNKKSGTKFSSYAYMYIYGKMYSYLNYNNLIKVNKDTIKLYKLILKTKDLLQQEYKREISIKDISIYLNIDEELINQTISLMTKPLSLEYEYDDENLYNAIKTYDQNNIYLNELLDSLDDDQRKVIMYKYFSGYSQSEIAKLMNMSQSGVSRTEKKSLEKMRVRSLV